MNDQLQPIVNRYTELMQGGNEQEARAYMRDEFSKLSQDLRDQLLGEMLTIAVEDKVEEQEALTELYEEGVEAFKALNQAERDLRKPRSST